MNDLKFAFRQLLKNPGASMLAMVSIAVGIGANAAIFSVAGVLLFHSPTGVSEPERLVDIVRSQDGHGSNPCSYPDYLGVQERSLSLSGVYASTFLPQGLGLGTSDGGREAERVF